MTSIRSHFVPDNIEGVKLGDIVYFHVTNLEQDWDVPHGFAVKGIANAELLIMPGETSDPGLETGESGRFSDVLYRLLFSSTSGNAGLYPGQSG
jgi:nitrous-oxide reductase